MITKEDIEVGVRLDVKEEYYTVTPSLKLTPILKEAYVHGWDETKNIIYLIDKEKTLIPLIYSIEQIQKGFELKPVDKWVDCPVKDISFATDDRPEVKLKMISDFDSAYFYLNSVSSHRDNHKSFYVSNAEGYTAEFTYCQIKESDLYRFELFE